MTDWIVIFKPHNQNEYEFDLYFCCPSISDKENAIFMKLKRSARRNGHFKVYNQKNIPARWHVNNTRRMGPILAVANSGYGFQDLMENAKLFKKQNNIPSK